MRDMLPADMDRFRRIETAFRDVCLGWGYEEVRTPTIEHLYLFTQAGTLSPQMLDRVYSFLDYDGWTGERVVLRPDSTIPAVRLFAEHMADRTTPGSSTCRTSSASTRATTTARTGSAASSCSATRTRMAMSS